MAWGPGGVVDGWLVERALGRGGMGAVWRCSKGDEAAALKVLDPVFVARPDVAARFAREAKLLAELNHPSVVRIRRVKLEGASPYLEMEYVEGENLEERLSRGPIPPTEAINLGIQLLEAIVYLHDAGVCHRDVKPANLVINRAGQLKLVDFGLAVGIDTTQITDEHTTFGTVSYAPPEWVRPDVLNPELWDLYACGVVLFEMLTGLVAFPGAADVDPRQQAVGIMTAKQTAPALDPGPAFAPELRQIVAALTEADPAKRLPTAREARSRLRALDPEATATLTVGAPPPRPAWARRRKTTLIEQPRGVDLRTAMGGAVIGSLLGAFVAWAFLRVFA